jgi:hypothetical protein
MSKTYIKLHQVKEIRLEQVQDLQEHGLCQCMAIVTDGGELELSLFSYQPVAVRIEGFIDDLKFDGAEA